MNRGKTIVVKNYISTTHSYAIILKCDNSFSPVHISLSLYLYKLDIDRETTDIGATTNHVPYSTYIDGRLIDK